MGCVLTVHPFSHVHLNEGDLTHSFKLSKDRKWFNWHGKFVFPHIIIYVSGLQIDEKHPNCNKELLSGHMI